MSLLFLMPALTLTAALTERPRRVRTYRKPRLSGNKTTRPAHCGGAEKENIMTDKMLNEWLAKYNSLEKLSDHYWDKMLANEEKGDADKVKRYAERMRETDAESRGMVEALSSFGYTIVRQNGEPVIVANA